MLFESLVNWCVDMDFSVFLLFRVPSAAENLQRAHVPTALAIADGSSSDGFPLGTINRGASTLVIGPHGCTDVAAVGALFSWPTHTQFGAHKEAMIESWPRTCLVRARGPDPHRARGIVCGFFNLVLMNGQVMAIPCSFNTMNASVPRDDEGRQIIDCIL